MLGATVTSGGGESNLPISQPPSDTINQKPFMPEQCLFCNRSNNDFITNLLHMQTTHGLFIPDKQRLIVELEVLIEYVHLVIYGYNECICCGTQRSSVMAVQQHMLGKGHCRFDIAEESSEFADFWNYSDASSGDEMSDEEDSSAEGLDKDNSREGVVQVDDSSLRLLSGKLISKNSPSQQHQQRSAVRKQRAAIETTQHHATAQSSDRPTSTQIVAVSGDGPKGLTKSGKKEQAFTTQLSRLSQNDRASLMHLPASQQRSILTTQHKQAEKAKKAERRYQCRVEGLGNKTLQAHYRPAGPMRANG